MLGCHDLTLSGRLSAVSAAIAPARITAICGPNGAGKSSLLQCLAGLIAPDQGAVTMGGTALSAMPPRERAKAIGYLPQSGEAAWDVAVRSLVALGRLPHRDARSEPIEAALAALDLTHLAARPISHLSGGERARALMARVLAGEPRWVLADEPLAALDLRQQLALLATLRAEAGRGTGVVVVLHDLALAMNHADDVLVLNEGRVAAHGAPAQALSEAVLATVWGVSAQWLGTPGGQALVVR